MAGDALRHLRNGRCGDNKLLLLVAFVGELGEAGDANPLDDKP